jgi:hypothetical protein
MPRVVYRTCWVSECPGRLDEASAFFAAPDAVSSIKIFNVGVDSMTLRANQEEAKPLLRPSGAQLSHGSERSWRGRRKPKPYERPCIYELEPRLGIEATTPIPNDCWDLNCPYGPSESVVGCTSPLGMSVLD